MKYELKKLKNGLRVMHIPMKNTETVTVLVLIGTGTHYENKKNNGVSHFLEHMFFKGTKKYPNSKTLNRELDAIGARHNAFTSKEETGYWVKVHRKHFDKSFLWVADILQNALIPAVEVERERNVIFEEMKMHHDTPRSYIWEIFEHHIFGDQPAGWDIFGTVESLQNLWRKELIEYWNAQYVASNAVVIVAGNTGTKNIYDLAERSYRNLRKGNAKKRKTLKRISHKSKVYVHEKDTAQVNLMMGVSAFPYLHPLRIPSEVLSSILGGYMTSRLFLGIRERRGLAYSVSAEHVTYPQTGYLAVYAGIPKKAVYKVPELIRKEFENVSRHGVTREELNRAKENIRGKLAISLESTDEVASYFGRQEVVMGKVYSPQDLMDKIDKVTLSDIQKVAKTIFKPSRYRLSVIGGGIDEKKLELVLK